MLHRLPVRVAAVAVAEQVVELPEPREVVQQVVVEAEPLEPPALPVDVVVEQREGAVTQHRRRHPLRTLRS
jgi:hypothetical protein